MLFRKGHFYDFAYFAQALHNAAVRMLRASIENGFFSYPYFLRDPLLDNLRQEPQFPELMNAARQRYESFKGRFL